MNNWMRPDQERVVYAMLNRSQGGWDDFAYYLGFSAIERLVFGQADNPVKEVFTAWRQRTPEGVTIPRFYDIIKTMRRNDIMGNLNFFLSNEGSRSNASSMG